MTQLNFGLIGAGRIGQVHAESLTYRLPEAKLLAVSDVYEAAAQACAAKFHIPHAHADHRAILDNPDIDAVAICSSTPTHAPFMIEAAQAGKHIFCEKPIALDLGKIDEALAAVEQAGVKLQIGFNRRFDANFRQLHETVRSGKIGTPHVVQITSRDPAPPPVEYIKASGGIFLDMAIHDFDMARYLTGSEVTKVYSAGAVLVDPAIGQEGDIDTAITTLWFDNGALGVIDNSRKAVYGYDQRAEIFGSKGSATSLNDTPSTVAISGSDGILSEKPLHFFLERYAESFAEELRCFIEAINNGTAVPGAKEALNSVLIARAAQQSLETNRPVIIGEG
jgi:myo-inositol 2-dehydrogenase/D-chiro-inositol 1-dehydrogenase